MKIIDIHGHLGDILYGKDIIYKKGLTVPDCKKELLDRMMSESEALIKKRLTGLLG